MSFIGIVAARCLLQLRLPFREEMLVVTVVGHSTLGGAMKIYLIANRTFVFTVSLAGSSPGQGTIRRHLIRDLGVDGFSLRVVGLVVNHIHM